MNPLILSRSVRLIAAIAIVAFVCVSALGQAAARPDRGAMPNRSYSVSDIENVSLKNGNVNVSIDLAGLPPIAGGKLSWMVKAEYNGKTWDVTRRQQNDDPLDWHPYVVDTPQVSDRGGWTIGGIYRMYFRNSNEDFWRLSYNGNSGLPQWEQDLANNNAWRKVVLMTPDGAEHEFRPTDFSSYSGSLDFLRGYYNVIPNGSPMRYYSVDGTYMFARITSAYDWTVYMNDGTQIIQTPDGIERIQDGNGNKIKIFGDSSGTHYQDEQTGREIRLAYDASANGGWGQYRVWYPTVGGTQQYIEINMGSTTVQGKVRQIDQTYCQYNDLISAQLLVVRNIVFPQTEPGQPPRQFTFSYNSDTTDTANDYVSFGCPANYQNYSRQASHGWGELSQINMPSGSVVNYTYGLDGNHNIGDFTDSLTAETIIQKTVTHDGTSENWQYSVSEQSGSGNVTNPDGSYVSEQSYCSQNGVPGCAMGKSGLAYRTSQPFSMVERHWTNLVVGDSSAPGGLITFNPVVDAEYTTLRDANNNALKMSAKTYQFDYNGNVTQTTEYDWFDPHLVQRDPQTLLPTGVPSGATALRVVNNSQYNQASTSNSGNLYKNRSINGLPLILNALQQTSVGASVTQLSYDNQPYGYAPATGNLTAKSVWDDVDSHWITTSMAYDSYGNVSAATDARGKVTSYGYDNPAYGLPNHVTVDPQNGTGTQTTSTVFDVYTGLVTSTTDPNNAVSTIDYTNQLLGSVDPFGRPGVAIGPSVSGSQHHRTRMFYADASRIVTTLADLNTEGDGVLKSKTITDQLGRTIETRQYESASDYIAGRQSYDIVNRIHYTSNPFRGNDSAGPIESLLWTTTVSDIAGRMLTATTPDSAVVTTGYYANTLTVTDQANKQRQSSSDALGRLTSVIEDPTTNGLNYQTTYDYDVLGNLRHVYQDAQPRGRLLTIRSRVCARRRIPRVARSIMLTTTMGT
jgi:YD repeat-containing protein